MKHPCSKIRKQEDDYKDVPSDQNLTIKKTDR
jgi:hypothetical protein